LNSSRSSAVGAKQVSPGRKAWVTFSRQRFLLRTLTRAKHSFVPLLCRLHGCEMEVSLSILPIVFSTVIN